MLWRTRERGVKNKQALAYLVLFILSFSAYVTIYQNQFVYDDKEILVNDHRIRSFHQAASFFTDAYWLNQHTGAYRPLVMLSFAANYALSGLSPWSYHLVNQLLHCLNVLLFFLFLGNFFPEERLWLRSLAAAVFAVHPAATEAVDLFVGRAELLSFAFSLSAFHLFLRRDRSMLSRFGAPALFFLGMLSKESSAVLPLLMLLHLLFFRKAGGSEVLRDLSGFGIALALYLGLRYSVLGSLGPRGVFQFFHGIPWTSTVLTMFKGLAWYGKIAFWPTGLQVSYDFTDIPVASSPFEIGVVLSVIVLLSVIGSAVYLYNRSRVTSFFLAWSFAAFLPVMNIVVPTGVLIAVRLMYLPLAGFSVVIATLLLWTQRLIAWIGERFRLRVHRHTYLLVVAAVLAGYSVLTVDRNGDWENAERLFRKDLTLSPRNVSAMRSLATLLPPVEGEAMIRNVLRTYPNDPVALSMLGYIYAKKGELSGAETMFRRSLLAEPDAKVHDSLGILLSDAGRLDEAEEQFRKAIGLKPLWANPYEDLAIVMRKRGDRAAARETVLTALRLNPDSAVAHNLLGDLYKEEGDSPGAIKEFQRAVDLDPRLHAARYNLADAYERVDAVRAVQAWKDYLQAAQGDPGEAPWVKQAAKRIDALSRGVGIRP